MTQAVLIRNADLYAPEHVGMRDHRRGTAS